MHQDESVVFFPEWSPLFTETKWNPQKEVHTYYELIGFRSAPYDKRLSRNGGHPPVASFEVHPVERRSEEGNMA